MVLPISPAVKGGVELAHTFPITWKRFIVELHVKEKVEADLLPLMRILEICP